MGSVMDSSVPRALETPGCSPASCLCAMAKPTIGISCHQHGEVDAVIRCPPCYRYSYTRSHSSTQAPRSSWWIFAYMPAAAQAATNLRSKSMTTSRWDVRVLWQVFVVRHYLTVAGHPTRLAQRLDVDCGEQPIQLVTWTPIIIYDLLVRRKRKGKRRRCLTEL